MSPFGKFVAGVIVVAAVISGIYLSKSRGPVSRQVAPAPSETKGKTPPAGIVESSANASIDQNMATIDSELSALEKDSSKVDEGLNDKPVEQTE